MFENKFFLMIMVVVVIGFVFAGYTGVYWYLEAATEEESLEVKIVDDPAEEAPIEEEVEELPQQEVMEAPPEEEVPSEQEAEELPEQEVMEQKEDESQVEVEVSTEEEKDDN
ncbi:hypothetical protein MWH28_08705 [Natroniella sulfidigena]|uniref:hypothetical protein n=1 Tax=Natroniella sulfidigena TaxID=723921 RepID=UPI00200AEF1D|nr:hypothetical protein [Natroniella sulfidigena]MCK8817437.1 hypothetical protein [Natroniella sulfidigena]